MEFTFSEEQDALRASVRAFLENESPPGHVAAMQAEPAGITEELWAAMVDLGWTGLLVPVELDGLGLGMVDMVVVLEEMGRVPFPGPYFSSAVAATLASLHLGLDDKLVSLAAGTTRGTVAAEELGHGDPVDRIRTRAVRRDGRWRLNGLKPLVFDGHSADWALVPARTEAGLHTFLVEAPRGELVPGLDVTRKIARLDLHDREAVPVGPDGDHTRLWRRISDDTSVALCAELIGGAEKAHDLAVEYAKTRVQFGRPIATFQVIKHKAVDMLHRLELARVGVHYAAWASDVDDAVREEAVAMSKAYCGEMAVFVSGESIQIHGGVGFTWDCPAHLHYRRAKQNDILLGQQGWQRRRLADLILATT